MPVGSCYDNEFSYFCFRFTSAAYSLGILV